jgi:hypothetical protein
VISQEVVHSIETREAGCGEQQFFRRDRMDYHQNARLTVLSREQMARMALSTGCTWKAAAAEFKVSSKTAAK